MAGPAAVPGVDPSRVNTPDGLAACLDGLRRRRGLSYEAMERAAARLLSRSGRSRPEPLPKSTVGEIVTGKRLPTKGKLLTFLTVCEVAPADRAQWLAAWERAKTADLARPAGGVRVRDARPRLLGVHDAIQVDEKVPGELPVYVPRDIDDGLRAELAANAQQGCFVLLIGGSSVGKTRTLYEAVIAAVPDWWLVHPAGPDEVAALTQAPPPRTVVWLDELQRYLDGQHGLAGAVVRALLTATNPAVIIGALWPDRYNAYAAMPASGDADPHAREREVLDLATIIRIGAEFSSAERGRARVAAGRDRRLALALSAPGYGLTQTLAAAPQLVARWQDASAADPYGWALLTAALDVARLGGRAPLSADLLREAAPGYCTSAQQAEAPGNWFERALVYATEKLHGAAAALSPAGDGVMGQVAGYIVADYLIQYASRERRYARIPASTWDALLSHIRDPDDTARLADSASNRLLYLYAIPLYRRAAAGERSGAFKLAELLTRRGDVDGLRALADTGDRSAALRLADLLTGRGDLDGATRVLQVLRTQADADDHLGAFELAGLLARRGDLDGLRAQADAGNQTAAFELAGLLAGRGDLDGLRARADAGDNSAARRLAELLARRGDVAGVTRVLQVLRARADAGDRSAARRLAGLLAERGDLDGLRDLVDAGNQTAAWRLAELLARRGDLDGLRVRADAGDHLAACELADLLAQRGDLDGATQVLRARIDGGNGTAARRLGDLLAELLARRGDLDGLRAQADTGNGTAARRLAELLARRGDVEGLRALVDAGIYTAAQWLADLLARRGDVDGLRALANAGYHDAAWRLTQLLVERGDVDGLRALVDGGIGSAAWRLTDLLVERGDLDGLRARADVGNHTAASRLAELLARRGDLDGLRALVNAGDHDAGWRLTDLLAQNGRGEEAARLRRFGLKPDGSIAYE